MRYFMLLLLGLVGCGPTIKSGAFTLKKDYADRAFELITNRAEFELDCPKNQLSLVTLNIIPDIGGDVPSQVGVSGCGRRGVYIKSHGTTAWVMNTVTTAASATSAPSKM